MYPVSAAYKTAIAQNVRNTKISGTITLIDDTIINITDEDIALGSLYLTEQCVAGEDIEVGNVYASELGFTLKSPPENPYSLDGARVLINFGIDVGGGVFEYVPLGYFYVTEIERKHTAASLKALDGMILFDTDLTGVLTGGKPRTIISSCCSKVGITLATDTAAFSTFANADVDFALPAESKVKTCRDLIMWVCQALGCFARMNREGQLEIVPIGAGTSVKTISKAQRFSSDVSDFTVKITKVVMTVGETEYSQGTDGMTMALEENPLLTGKQGAEINTILGNILTQVTQAEYTPYNVNFAGDPAIQAGDWIALPDTSVLGGGDVVSLVTHSTWRYRGPHNIRAAGKGALLRGVTGSQQEKAISTVVAIATAAQALAQAANQSTQLIKDAIGGHVLIRREPGGTNEILIMDHPDPEQAVKIWRWNMGGLGYSDNVTGADNPDREYTVAMTMDGAINADFVRTGEINTNLVKILGNTNFYWDGDYLYIINPDDGNQQIRLSKEGIRFTQDGGQTWLVAMDFDGIRMEGQSQDGHTNYTGDGVKVTDEQGSLVGHLGSFETPSGQAATFTRSSVAYTSTGTQVAANVARFEDGKFDEAVLVEEGTTNVVADPSFENADITANWNAASAANWAYTGMARVRDTTRKKYGSASVKCGDGATYGMGIAEKNQGTAAHAVSAGQIWTLSFDVYATNADTQYIALIRCYDSSGNNISNSVTPPSGWQYTPYYQALYFPQKVPGANAWYRITKQFTVPSGVAYVAISLQYYAGGDYYVWFDGVQFENKPYATSFTPSTRSPEILTIPGEVMPDNEGTITLWARKNDVQAARARKILDAESPRIDWQWSAGGDYFVDFGGANFGIPDPAVDVEWHFYAITYSGRTVNLYFDGVKVGTGTATVDLVSFSDLTLGSRFNGTNQADALIDDLRISRRARTDQEIADAYASGQPLPVDEWTTWKSSFDGHLHNEVPVRKYGLMLKHGTIRLDAPSPDEGILIYDTQGNLRTHIGQYAEGTYGAKVINGEIYSSRFRTGLENATEYIELVTPDILQVIYNNDVTLKIQADTSSGAIRFFDRGTECMRLLSTYDLGGVPYAVMFSMGGRPLALVGPNSNNIRLNANGSVFINTATGQPLNIYGDTYINNGLEVFDDIHTFGNLSCDGTKPAIQQTENYGRRAMYARESPNLKFIDEGVSHLTAGQCRIELDPIFLETIEPHTEQTPWVIHCTPYADIDLYVTEIGEDYIVIRERNDGISDSYFSWSIAAFRKGYSHLRMEEYDIEEDILTSDWEDEYEEYAETIPMEPGTESDS